MLRGPQIAEAGLTDWRKLAQGLHARYVVEDFGAAARFVAAIGQAGDEVGHHPRVRIGDGHVDLELVSELEIGLDTAASATIAPVWAALLTGDASAQGRGTPGDEVRDATVRVPNLWFGDADEHAAGQAFQVEVYVAPEVVEQRLAAVLAAGGVVVDDSEAPGFVVVADQDGNRGLLCADLSAVS
jgi:4a-hydroxytetrahydrobiopterin dehydratase